MGPSKRVAFARRRARSMAVSGVGFLVLGVVGPRPQGPAASGAATKDSDSAALGSRLGQCERSPGPTW